MYIVSHVAPDEKPPMSSLRPAAACQGNISRMQTGSQSSVEHSAGYWERQMEANRAPLSSLTVCFVGCEIYHGN